MEIRADGWLSERFGHPVFTLRAGMDRELLREHTEGHEPASYQAKVPTGEVGRAHELCDAGFRIVCTAVTLRRDPGAPPVDYEPGESTVRPVDPARDASLPELAPVFVATRFHLDPDVPNAVAERVKRDWIAALVTGERGEETLVAELDGRPVGFLGVVDAGGTRTIDLIAVAPEAQDRGAGRALVRRFVEDSRGRCDALEVGTQAANGRAIRWYEQLGFLTARTAYDLHMHVGSPWTA